VWPTTNHQIKKCACAGRSQAFCLTDVWWYNSVFNEDLPYNPKLLLGLTFDKRHLLMLSA
jgi:hypothetical protein